MTFVEHQALSFSPRNFAKWLLVMMDMRDCDFDDENAIIEYFKYSGICFCEIQDSDDYRYIIHLKQGVQDVVFFCWWYATLVDSCGYKHIGQDYSHVMKAIDMIGGYEENLLV